MQVLIRLRPVDKIQLQKGYKVKTSHNLVEQMKFKD